MASQADLEAREAECNNAADYAALAAEALSDPADKDYARKLLEKAEMQCQMPPDYVVTALGFAEGLEDKDYAADLLEQAEDMCFEPLEFAEVAHGYAVADNKDKAAELLRRAADEASALGDFLKIAGYARADLNDDALAGELLAKVEEKAKDFQAYKDLAAAVAENGDTDTAKGFYKKAARYCDDIPATVDYARGWKELFDDEASARSTLDDAEMDCQFTKEFVALSTGYQQLFDDTDKVNELMDQAAEFAMTGEEQADLAVGYWDLLQDKEKAADAYRQALADIVDKTQLLDTAKHIAVKLQDTALAKDFYTKAEGKMSGAGELSNLAQTVLADLDDKAYAAEIYARAAESLSNPADLINLANDVAGKLGEADQAKGIYQKALGNCKDFGQTRKLLDNVVANLKDAELILAILEKAESVAEGTQDLIALSDQILQTSDEKAFAARTLEAAEEQVTSIAEMKAVVAAVEQNFADDADWTARVKEKQEKREANQAAYNAFQEREAGCSSVINYVNLADQVIRQLEDRFYARKLLVSAEKALEESGRPFVQVSMLALAADRLVEDLDWSVKLLDQAAQQAQSFADIRSVSEAASTELSDSERGRGLAKSYLSGWEEKLDQSEAPGAYDYSKLAQLAAADLADKDWSAALLEKAATCQADHLALAHMGGLAAQIGRDDLAVQYHGQAMAKAANATQAMQVAGRLQKQHVEPQRIADLYRSAGDGMSTPAEKLSWAEGILSIFRDNEWATQAYDAIETDMDGSTLARYKASRKQRLEHRL